MVFEWKEFLEVSKFLKQKCLEKDFFNTFSQEAAHRSGVGRAYYSVFCVSREFAAKNQNFIYHRDSKKGVHEQLVIHFQATNDKLARYLQKLRYWRTNCDYDLFLDSDSFIMLDASIKLALEAFKQIEKMKSSVTS